MKLQNTRPDGVKVEREVSGADMIAKFKSMGWKEATSTSKSKSKK